MWNGVNDKIELTSISNHCKEGDRCTLKMSWINNLLVPLNAALLYFTSQLNILYLIKKFGSTDREVEHILE
jgi:hypothetical protein